MNKPSDLKVMKSNAGYYVGRSQFDDEMGIDMPYSRESGYYPSKLLALDALDKDMYFRF